MKGDTVDGRGAGSLSNINFYVSLLVAASNGSLPVDN
jgi:hypothetical protein